MADPGIVREWVLKAEEDFEFARISLHEKKPFYSHICFLFQQSAEKHLKALSLALGLGLQKTHDLLAIIKRCSAKIPSVLDLANDGELLTTFYVETRYPVHWPASYGLEDAEIAYQAARRIRDFVRQQIRLG